MDESSAIEVSQGTSFREKHGLPVFIGLSVILAVILVAISMAIYNNSGAAQLDLSRPGYVSVRSQANDDEGSLKAFSSFGSLDRKTIEDFKTTYDKQSLKTESANAFSGDPLSPSSLGMDVSSDTTQ